MRIGRTVVPLLVILVAAACTRVVDGSARPARGLTPRPITGQTVKQVLLDESELSKMLGQPAFIADRQPDGTAIDIAHQMMDKVSNLS